MAVKAFRTFLAVVALLATAGAGGLWSAEPAGHPLRFRDVHVIRPGESLGRVANRYGMRLSLLRELNPGVPDRLAVGSALAVETPWHALPELEDLSNEFARGVRGGKRIALTFDCGWTPVGKIQALLNTLRRLDVPAAFFLTGPSVQAHPREILAIVRAGHTIGNHTWDHPDCTTLDDGAIRRELARLDDAVTTLTGQSTRPWWRAPYGKRDRRVRDVVASEGYRSVYWTVDSLDWMRDPPATSVTVHRRICVRPFERARAGQDPLDGAIVLFHAASSATPEALPRIVTELRGRGYRFVPLPDMLRLPPETPGVVR